MRLDLTFPLHAGRFAFLVVIGQLRAIRIVVAVKGVDG